MKNNILYVISNFRTGEILSDPSPDDQVLWDEVEKLEASGVRYLVVRIYTEGDSEDAK